MKKSLLIPHIFILFYSSAINCMTEDRFVHEIYEQALLLRKQAVEAQKVKAAQQDTSSASSTSSTTTRPITFIDRQEKPFGDRVLFLANLVKKSTEPEYQRNLKLLLFAQIMNNWTADKYDQLQAKCTQAQDLNMKQLREFMTEINTDTVLETGYKDDSTVRTSSYHEASHAHVFMDCMIEKKILYEVNIEHRQSKLFLGGVKGGICKTLSQNEHKNNFLDQKTIQHWIQVAYAGGIAESLWLSNSWQQNLIDDIRSSCIMLLLRPRHFFESFASLHLYKYDAQALQLQNFYTNWHVERDIELIKNMAVPYAEQWLLSTSLHSSKVNETQSKENIKKMLRGCFDKATAIIENNRASIEKTAAVLRKDGVISGDEVYRHAGVKRPDYFFEKTDYIKSCSNDTELFNILATPKIIKMQSVARGYLARKKYKKLQKEAAEKAFVQDSLPLIAAKACHQRRASSCFNVTEEA